MLWFSGEGVQLVSNFLTVREANFLPRLLDPEMEDQEREGLVVQTCEEDFFLVRCQEGRE